MFGRFRKMYENKSIKHRHCVPTLNRLTVGLSPLSFVSNGKEHNNECE